MFRINWIKVIFLDILYFYIDEGERVKINDINFNYLSDLKELKKKKRTLKNYLIKIIDFTTWTLLRIKYLNLRN